MNNLAQKVKILFNKLLGLFPTALPIGLTEFNTWASSIIDTYDFPDNDSVRFSLAVMIMHLPSDKSSVRKSLIASQLHKGASNQVAAAVVQDLKAKQEAAQKAAAQAAAEINKTTLATPEATSVTPTPDASDGQKQ